MPPEAAKFFTIIYDVFGNFKNFVDFTIIYDVIYNSKTLYVIQGQGKLLIRREEDTLRNDMDELSRERV